MLIEKPRKGDILIYKPMYSDETFTGIEREMRVMSIEGNILHYQWLDNEELEIMIWNTDRGMNPFLTKRENKMNKFYFNTGVRYGESGRTSLYKDQVWRNGVLQIPFECDAPENATLMFCCDKPDLPESKLENVIVCEIFNSSMCSKYAYFRI